MSNDRVNRLSREDLMILLPQSVVGEGEPGEALTPETTQIIYHMVRIGYAPMDFGEVYGDGATELWFVLVGDVELATRRAANFILWGGCV